MVSKKKIVIISVCAAAAVIAGGLGVMYKVVATPKRLVELSLLNCVNDSKKSFTLSNDKEWDIVRDMADGGKVQINMETDKIPILGATSLDITANSDGKCTICDIGMGSLLKIKTYKDDESILINTPLFAGGFEIPVKGFAEKWNSSIFKDIVQVPSTGISAGAVRAAVSSDAAKSFAKDNASEIMGIVGDSLDNIKVNGTANVMIGSKTKKAKVYTTSVSADTVKQLTDLIAEYIDQNNNIDAAAADKAKEMVSGLNGDYEVTFKLAAAKLRELEIKNADGNIATAAFYGISNPMDMIAVYSNGDTQNAVRRVHTEGGGTTAETITIGEDEIKIENGTDRTTLSIDSEGAKFALNGYGKVVEDDTIIYNDAELNADGFNAKGTISLSEYYDKDFSFDKKGQYVNLLEISQNEWETIIGAITGGMELFGIH